MSQSKFELLFTADTKQAKAATADLRNDVADLSSKSGDTSAALDKQTAALNREAEAARKAAEQTSRLAEAEAKAAAVRASTSNFEFETRAAAEARLGLKPSHPASKPTSPSSPTSSPQLPSNPAGNPKWADDVKARYVPLYNAQREYGRELEKVQKAERDGILTTDEAAAAQLRLKAGYDQQVEKIRRTDVAMRGLNDNYKLTAHEARNMSYQVNDVVQSLMLGMPVQQVFLQQGPQIAQIYGGVGNTLKAMASHATLARVAIGGIAAVAVTGASAWNSYLQSTKEVSTAANGLGRATAGSFEDMEAAAQAGAAAAGISVKSARSMEAQFLRTGKIGSENFEQLIGISKDFAVTFGMDAEAAGKALSDMFADPEKAAQQLYRQYGLIDAATARHATNLAQSNRVSEAQAVLLAALPNGLAVATEATTAFGRAWENVKNASSDAYDWIGRTIDRAASGPSLEAQIADAQSRYDRFSNQSQRSPFIMGTLNGATDNATQAKAELDALTEQKRLRDAAAAERKKQAEDNRISAAALGIAEGSNANVDARREQELKNQIAALQSATRVTGLDDTQRDFINTAIEAKTRALDALINKQARASELDRLDIQIANERNPLLRAELEARRARLELSGQEVSAASVEAAAGRARTRVIEETIAAASAQSADMQTELQVRSQVAAMVQSGAITARDANRVLQEELTLRPLIAAAAIAETKDKAALNKVIGELRDGYAQLAAQEKLSGAQDFIRTQRERIAGLQVELSVAGETEAVRGRIRAQLQAEEEIRHRGLATKSREADEIRAVYAQQENLNRQISQRSGAADFIRSQQERLASLQVELAVVGETETVRNRIMAQLEAEQEIRRRGLDVASTEASIIRANALEGEKRIQQLEKQADAWKQVREAGESTIDSLVDSLSSGDLSGALEDISKDLTKSLLTLSVTNPMKNAAFGTNYGTINDVGGFGGIISKLFGGGQVDGNGIIQSALGAANTTGSMNVQAAVVNIGGAGIGGLDVSRMFNAANSNAPVGTMAQYAAAIRNIESRGSGGYNAMGPITVNGDRAYGAYQVMGANIPGWTKSALGTSLSPQQFLSSQEAQDAVFNKIFGGYVGKYGASGAAQAWFAGPGSIGRDTNSSDLYGTTISQYVSKFETEVQKMAGVAGNATGSLGNLGAGLNTATQGLDQFGGGLGNLAQSLLGAVGGGTGSGLAGFFKSILGAFGFSNGGYTGPGAVDEPRGVVHAGEVVWSQRDVARAGGPAVVDAMRLGRRGYSNGGIVEAGPSPFTSFSRGSSGGNALVDSRPVIQVINQSSAHVNAEVEETSNERGQRQYKLVMSDMVGEGLAAPGRGRKTFEQMYGARRAPRRRT
ncbi:phage tail length tape measure family protein [Ochrobactrum chromiisoli]|uniref:Phage tail length tape measure family protein n=1 Tax=Ochrobactrum chromiisoli TaxID=2993941 RepID=A0ABT3QNA7_9HYPH|nr:phage tail length tape measure family protein [Ochrobactrum chromiisoli]MCX2697075.1 phage tail length tape measure family protein [Ochrobactrum chromiisoli]